MAVVEWENSGLLLTCRLIQRKHYILFKWENSGNRAKEAKQMEKTITQPKLPASKTGQRPVSTLLDKFKDNPANRGLILKERPDTPKNDADRWVLC